MIGNMKLEVGIFSRSKYREEQFVVLKELAKTKDEIITQLLSCIEDLTDAPRDKRFKHTQMLVRDSPKVSHTDFHPETGNVKIINRNVDTNTPANTKTSKISPKELEEKARKNNKDNY